MPIGPALDDSWGAVLIGVFFACFLYGLLTLQVYVYHEMFPRDQLWTKLVVLSVWMLDTLHTIFITYLMYTQLVTNFGDYDAIAHNTWTFNMNVCITTLVAAISQVFFIHRCWRFDKTLLNTVLSGVILCFAAVQFAFGMYCTNVTFNVYYYVQFLEYTPAVDTWLGSAACTDMLVSFALVRVLVSQRTDIQRTKTLIQKLIRWTVTTGMITSVWALLDLALFTSSENTLIHLLFNVVLAKLYANTLLAALNHRVPNRPEAEEATTHSFSLSRMSGSRSGMLAAMHPTLTTPAPSAHTHARWSTRGEIDDLESGGRRAYGHRNAYGYSGGGGGGGGGRAGGIVIGIDTEMEQSMDDKNSLGIDSPTVPTSTTTRMRPVEEFKLKPEEDV